MVHESSARLHIVLWQPEIPNNTGNIGRTCLALEAHLHLIKPLGFDISDKQVKRAGLDYWPHLNKTIYESWDDFAKGKDPKKFYFLTTKTKTLYFEPQYSKGDYLIFGRETQGLPDEIMDTMPEHKVRIPMLGLTRSLNLANSVAIAGYEVFRQQLMTPR